MRPGDQHHVWRIAKHTATFRATDLTGEGARRFGGRWNSKGVPAINASTSIALATLETLVHQVDISVRNTFLVRVSMPSVVWKRREIVEAKDFDASWLADPPGSTTIDFGDQWLLRNSAAILLVPSVIVPEEHNALINPAHPDIARMQCLILRQLIFDPRFVRLGHALGSIA